MGEFKRPPAFSVWTHREKGGEYSFLTVAKGTGEDHGQEFVYYLGLDKQTNALTPFVRRVEDWVEKMEMVDDGPEVRRQRELDEEADLDDLI